jgi:hypothetical protein
MEWSFFVIRLSAASSGVRRVTKLKSLNGSFDLRSASRTRLPKGILDQCSGVQGIQESLTSSRD